MTNKTVFSIRMANIDTSHTTVFKRLWGLLRAEKRNIYYIYFYSVVSGLLYLSLPIGIQAIVSLMFAQELSASLIILIALVISGVFLNGFMYILQMRVSERIQVRLFTLISLSYSDRLPKLQQEAINDYHLPELVNRFFDTASIQKGIAKLLLEVPVATIQILFGLTLLSLYHPVFIFFGILLMFVLYLVLKYTIPQGIQTSMEESDYKYKVGFWMEEVARNIKTFKLRGKTDFAIHRTNEQLMGYIQVRKKHFRVLETQFWLFIFFKTAVTLILLIIGCWLFFSNKINIGQFIATEIVIIMTLSSVEKIITSMEGLYDFLTALEKTSKVLDNPIEEFHPTYTEPISRMDISLHNVSFRYTEKSKQILNNINLSVKQGEKIAIIGSRGAGKSSILQLLTGAYTQYDGSIMVNNIPFFSYDVYELRRRIGAYFSESEIFEGSLIDNLQVGSLNCPPDEIMQLAGEIGLKEFILKHKDGIYQHLSTQGIKLAESTRAKILLGRALLKRPNLLLLDDFTYLLNKKDKKLLLNYLFNEKTTYTLMIKTSNEDIMRLCDRIIFMHEGRILADGSFDEISKTTEYQQLCDDLADIK